MGASSTHQGAGAWGCCRGVPALGPGQGWGKGSWALRVLLQLGNEQFLLHMSLSSQFCAICKLSEGTLCATIQITDCEQDPHSEAQGLAGMHWGMT